MIELIGFVLIILIFTASTRIEKKLNAISKSLEDIQGDKREKK